MKLIILKTILTISFIVLSVQLLVGQDLKTPAVKFLSLIENTKYKEAYALLTTEEQKSVTEEDFIKMFPEKDMVEAFRSANDQFLRFKMIDTKPENNDSILVETTTLYIPKETLYTLPYWPFTVKQMQSEGLSLSGAVDLLISRLKEVTFTFTLMPNNRIDLGIAKFKQKKKDEEIERKRKKRKKRLKYEIRDDIDYKYVRPRKGCVDFSTAIEKLKELQTLFPEDTIISEFFTIFQKEEVALAKVSASFETSTFSGTGGSGTDIYITIKNDSELKLYSASFNLHIMDEKGETLYKTRYSYPTDIYGIQPGESVKRKISIQTNTAWSKEFDLAEISNIDTQICTVGFRMN